MKGMGKIDKLLDSRAPNLVPEAFQEAQVNRRIRGDRLEVSFPVFATYKGSLIQGFIEALNISWSGMLLATNFPLNVGDMLKLEFTLPRSDVSITVTARVIHKTHENAPEEATCIGLAFTEMEPNVQRMISGFVLEHLPTD